MQPTCHRSSRRAPFSRSTCSTSEPDRPARTMRRHQTSWNCCSPCGSCRRRSTRWIRPSHSLPLQRSTSSPTTPRSSSTPTCLTTPASAGVSYYDKAPFQLRVGRVHTASGRVVMMGVCSSLDSLNAADEGKKNRSRVPDNLPMCSSEEPGMGPGGRTPIKRPAVGPSEATPRGPPHSSRRRGRLAALHFNSASD